MAAGIGFDQEPCGFEGACAQLEFLYYCAEPEEFSCRKRKKREESPAFRGAVVYKSNYVLGIEPRQEKMRRRIGFDNMCCRKFERDGVNREASETLTCIADVQTSESG